MAGGGGGGGGYNPPARPDKTKPSDFTAYDNSDMVGSMIRNIEEDVAKNQQQAGAQGSKYGTGRSSATLGGIERAGQAGQNQQADVRNKAAYSSWQDQVQQAKSADDYNMQRYGIEMNNYDKQMALQSAKKSKGLLGLGMFGL